MDMIINLPGLGQDLHSRSCLGNFQKPGDEGHPVQVEAADPSMASEHLSVHSLKLNK